MGISVRFRLSNLSGNIVIVIEIGVSEFRLAAEKLKGFSFLASN